MPETLLEHGGKVVLPTQCPLLIHALVFLLDGHTNSSTAHHVAPTLVLGRPVSLLRTDRMLEIFGAQLHNSATDSGLRGPRASNSLEGKAARNVPRPTVNM